MSDNKIEFLSCPPEGLFSFSLRLSSSHLQALYEAVQNLLLSESDAFYLQGGTLDTELLASLLNRKVQKFMARARDLLVDAMDALEAPWSQYHLIYTFNTRDHLYLAYLPYVEYF